MRGLAVIQLFLHSQLFQIWCTSPGGAVKMQIIFTVKGTDTRSGRPKKGKKMARG